MKVKRRIFLKNSLVLASMIAMSKLIPNDKLLAKASNYAKKILQGDAEPIHIVWIQAQTCSGDTVSLLNAVEPSIVDVLTGQYGGIQQVALDYQQTIIHLWGIDVLVGGRGTTVEEWDVNQILVKARNGEISPMLLVTEGAFPDEETAKQTGGYWCTFGTVNGEPIRATEWLRDAAQHAAAVVAVGTCATYGGIPSGTPNPTSAKGTYDILGKDYKSALGLPVINVPGCPAAGDWMIKVFAHLLLTVAGLLPVPNLDEFYRPKFLFDFTVHERCPRGIWYSSGKFTNKLGEPYCMFEKGCKGPIVRCPITSTGFVEGIGACTTYGSVCIGCTDPSFPDSPVSPFFKSIPAPTIPVAPTAVGAAVVGGVLGSLLTLRVRKGRKTLTAKRVKGSEEGGEE